MVANKTAPNTCGFNGTGYCLLPDNLPAIDPISLLLRRPEAGTPDSLSALTGAISRGGWRASALVPAVYFADGSECQAVMEHSTASIGAIYFRLQAYGCVGTGPLTTAVPAPATVPPNTTTPPPASTSLTAHASRSATTARAPTRTSSSQPPTRAPAAVATATATGIRTPAATTHAGPCRGTGDLNVSSGPPGSPFVLDCRQGSIDLLQYPAGVQRAWLVDPPGGSQAVMVWFESCAGFGAGRDYVTLAPPAPAQPVFLTGVGGDPTQQVRPPCDALSPEPAAPRQCGRRLGGRRRSREVW